MIERNAKIFISCGQYSEAEKSLGRDVEQLVREATPYKPYLAQNQSTLNSLTQTVFQALDECTGFIGIMHHRGEVRTPGGTIIRGSVWIEQEIAIAAFLRQLLGRDIHIRLYTQRGLALEGLRDKLQANPIVFETDEEILSDLRSNLGDWAKQIAGARLQALHFDIKHRQTDPNRNFRFQVILENTGTSMVDDYIATVEFPLELRPHTNHALYVPESSNPGFALYRRERKQSGFKEIFPGNKIEVVSFDYYAPSDDSTWRHAMSKEAVVSLYSGGDLLQQERQPISDLV